MKRYVLGGCAVLLAFLSPASPLAAGKGKAGSLSHPPKVPTNGAEAPIAGRTSVADAHRDQLVNQVGATLGGVGHAFRHAVSSAAAPFHRPPGWDRGNKTGWGGSAVPPGQAKKDSRFASAARASNSGAIAGDIGRRGVANFDRFLDMNPGLDKSLSQNPSLINNQAFLANNPSLGAWLKAHPQAAAELRESPRAFVRLEHRFDTREAKARFPRDEDIRRREVANFDRFLDTNPGIAASLKTNPSLINNSAFLSQHAALSMWLKTHPEAAEELRENPQAFFSRERRFEATHQDALEDASL